VRRAATLVAACALLVPAAARANPIDAFGFGARGPAMGGAQTAATRDGGANYYNPGAIAMGDDIRIDLGYQLAAPRLSVNGGDQGVDTSRGLAVGFSAPGTLFGAHVAFGAGVFLPDERVTRARTLAAGKPRWALYDNRPQRIFLGSNFAVRLGQRVFIGAGIAYMSRTSGTLDLTGRVGFPDETDSSLNLSIDTDVVTIRYPQAGILVRVTDWLDVGASYRGGFVLELDQKFSIRGDVGPADGPIVVEDGYFLLHSIAQDLFQPEQWSLGFAAQLTPRVLLAGDLTWQRWSAMENPAADIEIELDLKDFNDLVMIPDAPPLPALHFHDIVVPRLGVEVLAHQGPHTRWMVRGGYAWEPSPAPEQQGETNLIDNDKHTVSLGLGVEVARVTEVLPRPFDVDVYVATTFLPERAHRKISIVDPVGDYVSDGYVLAAGLTTRWHF
jgi:long-chain fatty acid transport protein